MTASDFTTSILVDRTSEEVYNAINNVSGWWQGQINGSTEKVNDEFTYRMKDLHYSKQKVVQLIPNKKIVWEVTDSKLKGFKNPHEWTGTHIIFELTETGPNQSKVQFTHDGLVPDFDCYGGCSWGWAHLIEESLFSLITTGKAKEVFG